VPNLDTNPPLKVLALWSAHFDLISFISLLKVTLCTKASQGAKVQGMLGTLGFTEIIGQLLALACDEYPYRATLKEWHS
jgi:hypothetical protein